MREVLGGIFTWSRFSEPHGYDFNGHLIRHAEGNLCIDPVEPDEEVAGGMAQSGRPGLGDLPFEVVDLDQCVVNVAVGVGLSPCVERTPRGSARRPPAIQWGARRRRPVVIGAVTDPARRNGIGVLAGSYAFYRAMAVAVGSLDPVHVPDRTDTAPAATIAPSPH